MKFKKGDLIIQSDGAIAEILRDMWDNEYVIRVIKSVAYPYETGIMSKHRSVIEACKLLTTEEKAFLV
jgi:hypothetical protein